MFLFTDIEGSMRLWEEHTGEMTAVIARHDEILQEEVEGSGGRITKHTSDGITAAWCRAHFRLKLSSKPSGAPSPRRRGSRLKIRSAGENQPLIFGIQVFTCTPQI